MFKILICIVPLLLSLSAYAQQKVPVTDGTEVSVTVSANTLNRLAVENDRITTVKGITGQFQLDKDTELGQVFIQPIATDKQELIHLFLLTEKGHTYPLSLSLQEGPAESILLMPVEQKSTLWEQSSSYETLIRTVIQAMHNQTALEGFAVENAKKRLSVPNLKHATVIQLQTYKGTQLAAFVLEVRNTSKAEMTLTESLFYRKGIRAVSIVNPILSPGSKTQVYVVN